MRMTLLWICLGLTGCARHGVKCDAHLQAINQPAHASSALKIPPSAPAPVAAGSGFSDGSSP